MTRKTALSAPIHRLTPASAVLALGIALAGSRCAGGASPSPDSLRKAAALPAWPQPPGWKAETIPFPIDFAPAIHHAGIEEIRFAPGFFQPSAPGYFSYAFVWWIEDREPVPAAKLAAELNAYFSGLSTAVGGKKFKLDPAHYRAELKETPTTLPGWEALAGQAELYDAFTNGQPLSLRLYAYQRACPALGHRAVLMLASPQPESAPIWAELHDRAESFRCP